MANMSYCRFQNTRIDLQDCIDGLVAAEIDSLFLEELRAVQRIYELCQEFIDQWDEQGRLDDEFDRLLTEEDDPDRYKSEESEREY